MAAVCAFKHYGSDDNAHNKDYTNSPWAPLNTAQPLGGFNLDNFTLY